MKEPDALNEFKDSYRECLYDESFASQMHRKSLDSLADDVPELSQAREEVLSETAHSRSRLVVLTEEEILQKLRAYDREYGIENLKDGESNYTLNSDERDVLRQIKILEFISEDPSEEET